MHTLPPTQGFKKLYYKALHTAYRALHTAAMTQLIQLVSLIYYTMRSRASESTTAIPLHADTTTGPVTFKLQHIQVLCHMSPKHISTAAHKHARSQLKDALSCSKTQLSLPPHLKSSKKQLGRLVQNLCKEGKVEALSVRALSGNRLQHYTTVQNASNDAPQHIQHSPKVLIQAHEA